MKIESLKEGMTVYDVHSHRMGNTVLRTLGCWQVKIVSIDPEHQSVMASWNGNAVRNYYRGDWSRWRLKEPVMVKIGFCQYRLETKDEKKSRLAQIPLTQ